MPVHPCPPVIFVYHRSSTTMGHATTIRGVVPYLTIPTDIIDLRVEVMGDM
jgi:hypothetical protein